jgi:hypothetical protein
VAAGVVEEPFTAEACAPQIVGQRQRIAPGTKTGAASVEAKSPGPGRKASARQVRAPCDPVHSESARTKRPIDDAPFRETAGA